MPYIDITRQKIYSPVLLIILDGWGISPSWGGNAIAMDNPPFMNYLWRHYPHQVLQAFAPIAGPYKKVGNSEIGHTSIGAGQIINQDSNEIFSAIDSGLFFKNPIIKQGFATAREKQSFVHFMGLFSDGNVHSNIEHLFALMEFAAKEKVENLYIHLITDGIDTNETSGLQFLAQLREKIARFGLGKIATMTGRFYAMDRDQRWDLILSAYKAQALLEGNKAENAEKAFSDYYKQGINDFKIPPTVLTDEAPPRPMVPEDTIIFYNFRPDRARHLTASYTNPDALKTSWKFKRQVPLLAPYFIGLTSYRLEKGVKTAFPPKKITSNLAKIFSDNNIAQLHAAESEKSAHVTYFFNGGEERLLPGEDRIIIPSLPIDDYVKAPELSTPKMIKQLIKAIDMGKYGFILVNIPNVDMLAHTGDIQATQKAIRVTDESVKKLVNTILPMGGAIAITADHGNAEQMVHIQKELEDPETIHTLNPVPFILITPHNKKWNLSHQDIFKFSPLTDILRTGNSLADVAPTILEMMGLEIPREMTGMSLLERLE